MASRAAETWATMVSAVHIYDRPRQPATRWVDVVYLPGGRVAGAIFRCYGARLSRA